MAAKYMMGMNMDILNVDMDLDDMEINILLISQPTKLIRIPTPSQMSLRKLDLCYKTCSGQKS